MAALKEVYFIWNATPWVGPFLSMPEKEVIWDRLVRDKTLKPEVKELNETAILHLGSIPDMQRQNICVMFPRINKSMQGLAEDKNVMKLWTDDVWGPALQRFIPSQNRDDRFGAWVALS